MEEMLENVADGDAPDDKEKEAVAEMFENIGMEDDMTLCFTIRMEGGFQETSARHAGEDKATITIFSGSYKSLCRAALDQFEEVKRIFEAADNVVEEVAKALEALVPGLKMEVAEEIVVVF